jgi:hypothetical protein
MTGNVVNQVEYDILVAMDREFCAETNKDLEDQEARRLEAHQKELEQATKNKRRGK